MILGITGTNGAGKGTVVDYLVEKDGFKHYSAREFILDELRARGLIESRPTIRETANDLRKQHGPAYVIEQLLLRAKEAGGNAVIESVRTVGEAQFLKSQGAYIGAVDADRHARYDRISGRGTVTDNVSFEQFCAQEDIEMNSQEPWDMNVFGVMKMADFVLTNDGSVEELYSAIEVSVAKLS